MFLMGELDNYESLGLISMQTVTLISLTELIASEPSFTASVTSNEIKKMIIVNTFSTLKIPDLPCHTQSVARHIKLASDMLHL